jgi:hypothetical protein
MFVGDVDTVQTPDTIVASTVRLQSAHEFDRSCGRAIDSRYGTCFKMGLPRTYWERSVVAKCSPAVFHKFDSEEIKSGSQIVNTISQNRSPLGGDWNERAITIEFVASTQIFLRDDAVWPERFESPDGGVKISKVFFGSVNLYADTRQVRHEQIRSDKERRVAVRPF